MTIVFVYKKKEASVLHKPTEVLHQVFMQHSKVHMISLVVMSTHYLPLHLSSDSIPACLLVSFHLLLATVKALHCM